MKHAHVKIDGVDIPLIGIPKEATMEMCVECGTPTHLQNIRLVLNGDPWCIWCLEKLEG